MGVAESSGVDPDGGCPISGSAREAEGAGGPRLAAGIALNPAGEVFIADGYANARAHKFSPEGRHLLSWGQPGAGDGQFMLPHGVWIDRQGRVLVADRENNRVQAFNQDGEHLATWPAELIGPAVIYVDDEDTAYIPEHNGGLVSIMTLAGERLAQWGSMENRSCHGIWVDSHKDLYVVMPGYWGRNRRVVKFFRKG